MLPQAGARYLCGFVSEPGNVVTALTGERGIWPDHVAILTGSVSYPLLKLE